MSTSYFVMMGLVVTAAVAGACGEGDAATPQVVHPTKAAFAEAESWPAIAPGQVALANFEPFRAVYRRSYTGADGPRHDRVVITAERIASGTTAGIIVTLIDTGNLEFDDTSPRTHTRMFAEEDQTMMFQIEPVSGTPWDYSIINTEGARPRATIVENSNGQATVQEAPIDNPQLGAPALWIVGSMGLQDGQTIRFASAEMPATSNILGARPFLVSGLESIPAGPLGQQDAWAVDYPLGMENGRVMQNFVIDRPPYIVGKRAMDRESGEADDWSLVLLEFAAFGGGSD